MKRYFLLVSFLFLTLFFLSYFKTEASSPYFIKPEKSILDSKSSKEDLGGYNAEGMPLIKSFDIDPPQISAESYLVVEKNSLAPILKKEEKKQRPIASLTKLMTYKLISEKIKSDEVIKINNNEADLPPLISDIRVGDEMTAENIIKDMLIESSNNATQILSGYYAEKNGVRFIDEMNKKAIELGMFSTKFSNPIGLDYAGNYSTAQDLVYLTKNLLEDDLFVKTVSKQNEEIEKVKGEGYKIESTNELLKDKEVTVLGVKTGKTPGAGECLISYFKTKNGQQYISVVLGSNDRFGDTKRIIEWIENNLTF